MVTFELLQADDFDDVAERMFDNYVLSILPSGVKIVQADTDKANLKSQQILLHVGLELVSESHNGQSYRFQGNISELAKWVKNE